MKNYVDFDYVINAMRAGRTIALNDTTVSFENIDTVTNCFSILYTDMADMVGSERRLVLSMHGFQVYRAIRCLVNDLYDIMKYDKLEDWDTPDRYTRVVQLLLQLGISPTPALYNIMLNTDLGMRDENCYSVGESVILNLAAKCDNYDKIINNEFFEDYNAFENMDFAGQIEELTKIKVPNNLFSWLSGYQWNSNECEYIRTHFKAFCNRYESEVLSND